MRPTPHAVQPVIGAHVDRSGNRDGNGPILVLKHRTRSP
ncbi:hypothetical protein MGAST_13360 [Mycobacterium gastri 'Wayne']|nr:hypothetical protein MGAST_13360 [Mycobacterium gastri 'Wayne']